MKKSRWAALVAAVAFGALSTSTIAQDKPQSLDIGVFTFTSGGAAAYGMPGKNAAELMIEQINAAGGVAGVPIKATYVDEAQGTDRVIAEFRRIGEEKTTEAMIAPLSSGNCLAVKPVVEQLKIPTVAWNCDAHQLLMDGKSRYFFRPNSNTVSEFAGYAIYVLQQKPDIKRIAMINPDYAMGHDAAAIFKSTMLALKPDVEFVAELFPKLGTSNFQTQVSRLAAAKPDVIFSALWGADLENFVRQALPRGIFTSSEVALALGETILQRIPLPDGVIVGVLGDGWWLSPDAQKIPGTEEFAEAFKKRYGEYPVFPAMKMANAFKYLVAAYKTAMDKNGGKWPTHDQLADAMRGSTVQTMTGVTVTREDGEGIVDQVIGVTEKTPNRDFPIIGQMVRYKGASMMAPMGTDPLQWTSTLNAAFLAAEPKPGSYK